MRKRNAALNVIYSLILLSYPMVRVTQGLSPVDTTYSPANFLFFHEMKGTWIVATYLANVFGAFLTALPGGDTLLGLNVYTSILVGATALIPFWTFKKDLGTHVVFVGEMLALGLCWCPTTVLYNYLTYFLFTAGACLLYRAVTADDRWLYYAAGAFLGMNVLTRLPNVTEAALIVVTWFAAVVRRRGMREVIMNTLRCLTGYVTGFLVPWIVLSARFSPGAYFEMIHNMFAMTDKAVDYKPTAMIAAMFEDYAYAGRWIALWTGGCVACVIIWYVIRAIRGRAYQGQSGRIRIIAPLGAFLMIHAVVVRLCYGRGMFSFRYHEYGSMYFWAVIMLFFASVICILDAVGVIASVAGTIGKAASGSTDNECRELDRRILALLVLVITYVTCLGSNNGLYPIVNNLFIVAPYLLRVVTDVAEDAAARRMEGESDGKKLIPRLALIALSGTLGLLFAGAFIQSVGFHFSFAFGDGIYGEPRDSYVRGHELVAGIRTNSANANSLQGLMDYVYEIKDEDDSLITYGDVPGLGYLLEMPSALTTFWPDLDSYNYSEWERDVDVVRQEIVGGSRPPMIIVTLPVAAWETQDEAAIDYFGVDREEFGLDRKLNDLVQLISEQGYCQTYANDAYVVYEVSRRNASMHF